MEYPKTKRLTGFDGIFMPREDWSRAYDPDSTPRACQEKRDMMTQKDIEDEKRYERQRKFFALDPYEELRLDITDPFIRKALKITSHELHYRYACEYWPPLRSIYEYEYNNNMPPPGDTFKIYENLPERPAYIIEYGSQIESARMLQICRYLDESNGDLGPHDPCYAIQVRFKTKDGFRYHYAIDAIKDNPHKTTPYAGVDNTWVGKTSQYIFLINRHPGGNSHLLDSRLDLFDGDFNYLGSNAWYSSKAMVPNAKPLPPSLVRKVEDKEFWHVGHTHTVGDWFKFPEYTDMVIEQRRAANSKGNLKK
jgi:hypothetical protein